MAWPPPLLPVVDKIYIWLNWDAVYKQTYCINLWVSDKNPINLCMWDLNIFCQIGTGASPTKPWQSHAYHPSCLLPLNWPQKIIILVTFHKWWLLGMIQFTEMLSSFIRDFLSVSERKSIGCYRLRLDVLPVKRVHLTIWNRVTFYTRNDISTHRTEFILFLRYCLCLQIIYFSQIISRSMRLSFKQGRETECKVQSQRLFTCVEIYGS